MSSHSLEDNFKYVPHAVLEKPFTYKIVSIHMDFDHEDQRNSTLTMTLRNQGEIVVLVFDEVHDLEIDSGFPWGCSGLEILDESSRGMDSSRVRVSNFEQGPSIRFWARDVQRVSA